MAQYLTPDWRDLLADERIHKTLKKVAAKRFAWQENLVDDAVQYCLVKMLENNCARLKGFAGKCEPIGFLVTVAGGLCIDFQRQFLPRLRPPKWISRLGSLWEKVFYLLCRDRHEPDAIVDRLGSCGEREEEGIWDAIHGIREREPGCGESNSELDHLSLDSEELANTGIQIDSSAKAAPDRHLESLQFQDILDLLTANFIGEAPEAQPSPGPADGESAFMDRIASLRQGFDLNGQDRLFLRMSFEDGLSAAEIARRTKTPEHTIRRSIKSSLAVMSQAFSRAGLAWQDLG